MGSLVLLSEYIIAPHSIVLSNETALILTQRYNYTQCFTNLTQVSAKSLHP